MKKRLMILAVVAVCAVSFAGCGEKNYADGVYTGKSQEYINDEDDSVAGNGYGEVTITIENSTITDCVFKTFELDGTEKDENYGKENGEIKNKDFYNKAQKALAACEKYAEQLVEKGSVEEIDAISGATVNYNEFVEAVDDALNSAETE